MVRDMRHRPAPSPGLRHYDESAAGNACGRHQLHELRQLARGGHDRGVPRSHPGAEWVQRRRRLPGGRLQPLPGADVRRGPRAAKCAPASFHSRREHGFSGRLSPDTCSAVSVRVPDGNTAPMTGSILSGPYPTQHLGAHRFQPQHCHHRILGGPQSTIRANGHGSVPAGPCGCAGERNRPRQPCLHRQQLNVYRLSAGCKPRAGPTPTHHHRPQPLPLRPT